MTGAAAYQFEFISGELCLDFANTLGNRTDPERRAEHLNGYDDLVIWAEQSGTLSPADAERLRTIAGRRPQLAARTFTRAIALREAIYDVGSAQAAGRSIPAGSLDAISREAAIAATHRRFGYQPRTGFGWEWEAAEDALDRPIWPIAPSATDLLTSPRIEFLRECALETCGWLFLDTSRNRTRRWCDMRTCGNRAKVRRFYQRARQGA